MAYELRVRRPLTPQEGALLRDRLSAYYEACDSGGTQELEVLALALGRQMATPMLEPKAGMKPERVRPLVYEIGATASLTVACQRRGVDPAPYLRMMEVARLSEVAVPVDKE